jgi:hypothetical protein
MKKWSAIIVSIIVASFVSLYAYQVLHQGKVGSLESIVPDSAIYYIYSYNLDKKIKDFQDSSFFQQISSLPLYKKFIEPKLDNIKATMPSVSDFIKKDFAVATFSLGGIQSAGGIQKDFGDFLILVRADSQKLPKLKKYMADFYLTKCTQGEVSYKRYKGIKIVSRNLTKEKRQVNFAFLSRVIVISNSMDVIQKSIDLYKNRSRDSLWNNKEFQQVAAKIKKDALLWGYQNNKNYYQQTLRSITGSTSDSDDDGRVKAAESLVKSPFFSKLMTIFKDSAFYIDYNDSRSGLVSKTYYTLNRAKDEEGFTDIFAFNKPLDKNIYNLIPGNSIAYYGVNHDMLKIWKATKQILSSFQQTMKAQAQTSRRYRQDMMDQMSLENALKTAEAFLGVNIEDDILPLLGDNFGAAMVDMEDINIPIPAPPGAPGSIQQSGFPFIFPRGFLFFELKDNSRMQEVMKGMFQRIVDNVNKIIKEQEKIKQERLNLQKPKVTPEQPQPQETEKVPLALVVDNRNGVDISRIEITDFPISSFKPNYCVLDKYLIFSLSPQLTGEIIDIYQAKKGSFSSSDNLERIQDKLPREYANIMFFDFRKLVDNVTNTKFYDTLESQITAGGSEKNFSKEDLDSVIKVLKNISNLTVTSNMRDADTLESSSYIEIEGL